MNAYEKLHKDILTQLKQFILDEKKQLEARGLIPTLDLVIEDIDKSLANRVEQGDETPESVDAVVGVGDETEHEHGE